MSAKPEVVRIVIARGTAARWNAVNPVLLAGEPALETDTGRQKIGDGIHTWTNIPYEFDHVEISAAQDAAAADATSKADSARAAAIQAAAADATSKADSAQSNAISAAASDASAKSSAAQTAAISAAATDAQAKADAAKADAVAAAASDASTKAGAAQSAAVAAAAADAAQKVGDEASRASAAEGALRDLSDPAFSTALMATITALVTNSVARVVDNGDGTSTIGGSSVIDNSDGTFTLA